MVRQSLPSVAIAVARGREVLWERGYGWADRERRIAADEHTPYPLASVTKPFTATALAILREQGRLDLDRPVNGYLGPARLTSPVWDPSGATVRRVATHTAGLATHDWSEFPLDETILRYGVLVRPPGERFDYSNLGYMVLGEVAARASGKSYADFLRDEIFWPLGMTRASVGIGPGLGEFAAAQYAKGGGRKDWDLGTKPGGAGVYCSAHDLVRFGLFHLKADLPGQRAIVPHAAIDAMQEPMADTGDGSRYGLGWWVDEDRHGYRVVFVNGGNAVAAASLTLVPSEGIAVAVLSNTGTGLPAAVADEILSALLPTFRERRAKQAETRGQARVNKTPPASLRGSWSGIIRTSRSDLPLEITVADAGEVRARLGSQLGTVLHVESFDRGRLFGRMTGDLGTDDVSRGWHELGFELTPRGDVLNGAVTAAGLSYWVELKRKPAGEGTSIFPPISGAYSPPSTGLHVARSQEDRTDTLIRGELTRHHIPGAAVAVVRRGEVILARGYGLANVESSSPATPETVFQIASVTKPFVATGIMVLVERGKVRLDEEIRAYIPGLPDGWSGITVRHLLAQTSGIKDYLDQLRMGDLREDISPQEIVRRAAREPLNFRPGERVRYSNTNYVLLGMIIERAAGKPWEEFLAERIFGPLGMTSTRRDRPAEIVPNRAAPYEGLGGTMRNTGPLNPTLWYNADGGLISTVLDLAKWDAALGTEKILKKGNLEQMWTPARLADGEAAVIGDNGAGKPNHYGLGWFLSEHRGHRIAFHSGDKPGFSCTFTRFSDDELTVIVLCNSQAGTPAFAMSLAVADLYLSD